MTQGYWDPSLSFNKNSHYVAERVSIRNNILKALAGTSWGQQRETLLMTYNAVGRSIINYAESVWSSNLYNANCRKKSNKHRMRLGGSPLAVTRCPISITCMYKLQCRNKGNTQSYYLHSIWPENIGHSHHLKGHI